MGRSLRELLSTQEQTIFTELGLEHLMDTSLNVAGIYRAGVEHAFVNEMTGRAVEALRRAYMQVFFLGRIFRMDPEFERLIAYEE